MEPESNADLSYLKKIVGSNNFSAMFMKINSHYKKISFDINVLQQTACLVVNPITFGNFAFLFNCIPMGQTSDSMMVSTQALIYWWDGRGLMLWLFSGSPGFTFWISFAPVFSFSDSFTILGLRVLWIAVSHINESNCNHMSREHYFHDMSAIPTHPGIRRIKKLNIPEIKLWVKYAWCAGKKGDDAWIN